MKLTITIDCDNAAFEENEGIELGQILADCARELRSYWKVPVPINRALRDSNGNTVGKMRVA